MKKWIGTLAFALTLPLATLGAGEKDKAPAEPFYRKYLVPGAPLDDQIVEQERRIQTSPEDANLRNDFGNLLARRRFPEQAAEQYEMAAKLDKNNFIALYNLGLLRETEGKTGDAVSAYKKSISRKPGFPPSRFRLGRLYERQGKNDDAVREYAAAMRIDPSMRHARRNPLVVDAELLYLASVQNYSRDLATASVDIDQVYVEEERFRLVPVDRALTSDDVAHEEEDELEPELESEPREVGPAGVPAITDPAARTPARRSRPPAAGEVGGPVLGGRARTPGARPPRMRTPRPPVSAPPAPVPEPAPEEMEPTAEPEIVPEPTPTPVPEEVEPS